MLDRSELRALGGRKGGRDFAISHEGFTGFWGRKGYIMPRVSDILSCTFPAVIQASAGRVGASCDTARDEMPEIGIRTPKPVTRTVISASSWTGGSSLLEPMTRGVSGARG